jgi:Tfp pilus assembly protein FimV
VLISKTRVTKFEIATNFLKEYLRDSPRAIGEIRTAAARKGLKWRTLETAKARLHIIVQRECGAWFWRLPGVAATDALSFTQEVAVAQTKTAAEEEAELAQAEKVVAEFEAKDRTLAQRLKTREEYLQKLVGRVVALESAAQIEHLKNAPQTEIDALFEGVGAAGGSTPGERALHKALRIENRQRNENKRREEEKSK